MSGWIKIQFAIWLITFAATVWLLILSVFTYKFWKNYGNKNKLISLLCLLSQVLHSGRRFRLENTHAWDKASNPYFGPPEYANHPETVSNMTASRTTWILLFSAFTKADAFCWSLNQIAHPLCYTPIVLETIDTVMNEYSLSPFIVNFY